MFSKKLKKQFLSINNLIESYFNKLKSSISNFKKTSINEHFRLIILSLIIVISLLSYFLLPTLYNKDLIELQIKNHIYKKYNFKIKFNHKLSYVLLPSPHFVSKNLIINKDQQEIGVAKKFKIFISAKNLFSFDRIKINDMFFEDTDFNISSKNLSFFTNLLKIEPNSHRIFFRDSNLFFKNKNEELLFLNKINDSEFYYDSLNLNNVFTSSNEIFNIPYKLIFKNDKFNKVIYTKFKSKIIRLNIENKVNYSEKIKTGVLDILFINKDTSLKYIITENYLDFGSNDNKNSFTGKIEFKPFYFSSNLNYDGISLKNLLYDDSILIDLINSEIFNNKNLNANININIKDITNIDELNNLFLKISIQEGQIGLSNSSVRWKNDLSVKLQETLISVNDNGINLIGKMIIDFENINNFYSFFQLQKKNRKKIQKIELDFVYSLFDQSINFGNPKVDGKPNLNLEKFINSFNLKDNRNFNKITFKNFINNFFKAYVG